MTLQAFLFIILDTALGLAALSHFKTIQWKRGELISLSVMLGLGISTLLVALSAILHLPLTYYMILGLKLGALGLLHLKPKERLAFYHTYFSSFSFRIRPYEFLFWGIAIYLIAISVWRALYHPVIPRDAIVGMDLVARAAVEEGKLVSGVFTAPFLEGKLSNQPFYAPFTTFSQINYLLAGITFGKLWLSMMVVAYLSYFYQLLSRYSHPLLGGLFLLLLIAIPEMYAYSFMFLTDYSNAVFFGLGVVFFYQFTEERKRAHLWLSALFFGFSCWSRSETLLFIPFGSLFLLLYYWRENLRKAFLDATILTAIPAAFFVLWNVLFFRFIFDHQPEGQFIFSTDFAALMDVFSNINKQLLTNTLLYGYSFVYLLLAVLINLIYCRNLKPYPILLWLVVLYLGFGLIAFFFPAATVDNTIKRSFFKFFPVIFFYISTLPIIRQLGQKITKWEHS